MSVVSFNQNLKMGQIGESVIAGWLKSRGSTLLPAYEKELDSKKGPRLFCNGKTLVTPDLFAFPAMEWIEAKHKTHFTWHRITKRWVTGIDLNHYEDYKKVQATTARRVWLFFLHRDSQPSDEDISYGCPEACPIGLFGGSLDFLSAHESHRYTNHGRHGMVYWACETLKLLAPIEEVYSIERMQAVASSLSLPV